jgi:hypothetical protein
MPDQGPFQLEPDARAREWLDTHPSSRTRVIAYDVRRCCGGGKICLVKVRELSPEDQSERYVPGALSDGTSFLIDRRAAPRLPARFGLTVRGFGPVKHLDLDLEGEQWGTLLYD